MTKDYIKRQFSNFYNEVIKGKTVSDSTSNDGFILTDSKNNIGVQIASVKDWQDATYSDKYGFGGYPYGYENLPPKSKFSGIVECDMFSVDGGKGRWNGTDTGNAKCGGHLFEGWNANHDARLTFGIGLQDKDVAFVSTFKPHSSSQQNDGYYGVTKIGDDRLAKGTLFSQSLVKCTGLICLATTIPDDTRVATQRMVASKELASSDYDTNNNIPYGATYFDATAQKVKVYTSSGWKTLAWEVE